MRLRSLAVMLALGLAACAELPPPSPGARSTAEALQLLDAAAQAHGEPALARLRDINVAYEGEWEALVSRLQPVLVDARFRGRSEERMLLGPWAIGQAHRGPGGAKQVFRDAAAVRVWYNDARNDDPDVDAAAALVGDGYRLFLLGPLYLKRVQTVLELDGTGTVEGRPCDWLRGTMRPGLGRSAEERIAMCVDRDDRLMRRVRFSLDGLASTRGAIAEVDVGSYVEVAGVRFPTRFVERLLKPIPNLPVHRWRVVGLDVNRGYAQDEISGPEFRGAAAAPASRTFAGARSQRQE